MFALVGTVLAAAEYVLETVGAVRLRLVLVVGVSLSMGLLPPWANLMLAWVLVLRYLPLAVRWRGLWREERWSHRAARTAAAELTDDLVWARGRIADLERQLARAGDVATSRPGPVPDPLYHSLGLHPGSPDWLVIAARRAFRVRLHPDRHPRHRQQAHERFTLAEARFTEIYARRGIEA
ncbi:J domain-containing protein [Methylorubrum extorquens]|uniref:J domain-containing protein n=1 Tax=Methylorubrum extorquens TaxID=408 RepID=UPI003F5EC514